MFKRWLFTIFINIHKFIIQRQFVCLNYFKNTLTDFLTSLYISQSQIHWKQLIPDRSQESSKYSVKIYHFLGFHEISGKNNPISQFCEIGFKIPLFSWNLEHTLDPWRVATRDEMAQKIIVVVTYIFRTFLMAMFDPSFTRMKYW